MKFLIAIIMSLLPLFGSLEKKSAVIYYGEDISYNMIGIHDYVIVQPSHINTNTHGFKVYKKNFYAYVSIGEIDRNIQEYKYVKKEWILTENSAWSSDVLDLKNPQYIEFLFDKMIEPQRKRGFENFFFDTLDSYQLACKTEQERRDNEKALIAFIKEFHKRYPKSKLVVNRGFEIIDSIHDSIDAVLFESYYRGIGGGKLAYKKVSDGDREWLDIYLDKIKSYNLDIISVDYLSSEELISEGEEVVKKLVKKGFIPYVANRELDIYGISSKNAVKREVFTLINEERLDRTLLSAHQYGGTVLEYMGYIQKLHDIHKGFPKIKNMQHYAGVVIWLQDYTKKPKELITWCKELTDHGIKVAFVSNFGFRPNSKLLKPLSITIEQKSKQILKIKKKSKMIGYEIEPPLTVSDLQIHTQSEEPLLIYENVDGTTSMPAAITEWGGYAVDNACMIEINKDNIWVIDPFAFFQKTLRLKKLLVPDVTTENGKRLLFTHIDGDGIMNRVEGDFGYYSGDVILNKILKVYKIPHSVSVIGAEISSKGLYPKIAPKLTAIAKQMYALENVEPATHTFTHPYFWEKIIDGNLSKEYRLKPKGYEFSIQKEISGELKNINANLSPKHKAVAVFWSGDCAPRINVLSEIEKSNIMNINGGDTTITRTSPWLSLIAPLGLQREEYTQVYTGAQNENVFTNDWLGPFWGFKRVVQTFKMTNSPRRFKPIDIYYHLYSGSKEASLRALKYVFRWAVKQDTMPIFTSEYIPKVMDYYVASIAHEKNRWLFTGMRDLKSIRIERKGASVDLRYSKSILGLEHFENHTYLSLNQSEKHIIKISSDKEYKQHTYLIAANAKVSEIRKNQKHKDYKLNGYVPLDIKLNVPKRCSIKTLPKAEKVTRSGALCHVKYRKEKKAVVSINCP